MRLPKKLQLLQISLPAIIALAVFAVVRLAPLAHAAPSDFIDIPNTQTGTITITLNNGSDNTGGDCYFFDISGLTGTAASYNGAGYWLGDGYPGWGINLLAGTGNYNIVVDGAGCTSYSDGALNIYMQGVTLTQLGAYSPLQLQNGAGVDLTVNGVNTFSSSTSAGIGVDSGNSIMITSGNGGVLNASSGRDSGIGGSGVSQFGNITIGGNVQVNASGMSGGIGGGGQDSYNFAGTITITDNARVSAIVLPGNPSAGYNSFGAGIGTGECAFCDSAYPGAGNTGKVVISGNAFVYADGSNSIQGYDIGAGYGFTLNEVDITGGTVIADSISGGLVNISGGFVYSSNILATNYQSDGANEGQNPILNKVSITSGSVFILNMSNASVIPSPTDASDSLVYPLYIPTTLSPNNANTANSNVDFSTATPSVPYTLHTLTPDQQAWFTTNGVTWPSDITATAWLPADNTLGANNQRLGTPYSNITAGATTTVFADQRPLYPTYTQALSSVANHLYSTIPVTNATNPTNQTVSIGSSTSFSSIVSLANPALSPTYTPTYQWQVSIDSGSNWSNLTDGAGISGSGTTALSLTNIPYAWNGYWYRLAIKTPLLSGTPNTGSAVLRTTAPATLTVNAPTITLSADSTVPIDVQPGKFSSNYGNVTVDYDGTSGVSLSMSLVNASNSSLVNTQDSTTTISSLSSQCWQINPCGFTQANNNMGGTSWWGWAFGNNGEGWNNFDDMTTETNVSASTHTWAAVAPDLSDGDISTLTTGFNGSYPFPWTAKVYFGVYASPIQKSGTYVGQVLYTAVAGI